MTRPVPDSLTHSQVADWLASIGIDPKRVPMGAALHLGPKSIDVEVFARNGAGKFYAAPDGKTAAVDRISIPIEDATPAEG